MIEVQLNLFSRNGESAFSMQRGGKKSPFHHCNSSAEV